MLSTYITYEQDEGKVPEGPQCGDDNAEYITYEQDEGKIPEGPQCGDDNAEQDLHRCPGLSQLQHPHLYRETM